MADPHPVERPRYTTAEDLRSRTEDTGRPGEQPPDDLEQTLMEVRRLIEATVAKHRDRVVRDSLITNVTACVGEVAAAALGLVAEAERTIDIVLADSEHVEAINSVYWELETSRKNIGLRLLCTQAMLDDGVVQPHKLESLRYEVRVARVPMLQVMLVDGAAALVTSQAVIGRQASVIRATTVIGTLGTLFEGLWRHAVPVEERIDFGDRDRADVARQILNRLQVGITDEVAARELSVSVRTYRRYVAEIMTLLGASSRFQAGVRAAELGLLPKGRKGSGHPPTGPAKGSSGPPVRRGARRQDVPAQAAARDVRDADGAAPRDGRFGTGSFL
ncbi:helix-turn-helix transcriptional regulator [Streptomyces viridosporus]|uniref:helix-turn-helix transcriptional regulator n=1 Tax=Streptomyces viridosporus TaxID=67581 RepID=UPI00210009F6|nr:transcriptional regulator [Streptomyces viridosporus]